MKRTPYSLAIQRHDRAGIRLAQAVGSPSVTITVTRPGTRWTLHRAWMREWTGAIK